MNKSLSNQSKRSQRSLIDKNHKKKNKNQYLRQFSIEQEQFSLLYRQKSQKKHPQNKHQNHYNIQPHQNKHPSCKKCQSTNSKLKNLQQHFKKVISLHNQQMCTLKLINEDLRSELQRLTYNLEKEHMEIEQLRQTLMTFNKCRQDGHILQQKNNKALELRLSAIHVEKQPLKIKKITQKHLNGEAEEFSLSQLLAGTPNDSEIRGEDSQITKQQKLNALRSQFQRLLSQCDGTHNKFKKSTIRKQLATIANQLSSLTKQKIVGKQPRHH